MHKTILSCCLCMLLLQACGVHDKTATRLNASEQRIADTLAKQILDNEGLFTVVSGLKPMSSVTGMRVKIVPKDSMLTGAGAANSTTLAYELRELEMYQKLINSLKLGDVQFAMNGYKMQQQEYRNIFINVFRKSLVDSLIRANQNFFAQFGVVPGSDARQLIVATEFGEKYDRYQAYGYLFGYPEHAVTFFTEASRETDTTKQFVPRDFFQIPVFDAPTGHFVYAIPKNSQPGPIDSGIYKRAEFYLEKYKKIRKQFTRKDGSVKYRPLLEKMVKYGNRKK